MRIFGSIQPKSEISSLLHLISTIMPVERTYSEQITKHFLVSQNLHWLYRKKLKKKFTNTISFKNWKAISQIRMITFSITYQYHLISPSRHTTVPLLGSILFANSDRAVLVSGISDKDRWGIMENSNVLFRWSFVGVLS